MLDPRLRTRLNRLVASARKRGASVLKAIVESGMKTKPSPKPWMTPETMTSQSSISAEKKVICQSDQAVMARPKRTRRRPSTLRTRRPTTIIDDHGADAAGGEHQADRDDRIAEEVLQHRRQQRHGGEQDDADDEDEDQRGGEVAVTKKPRIEERLLGGHRVDDEGPGGGDGEARARSGSRATGTSRAARRGRA